MNTQHGLAAFATSDDPRVKIRSIPAHLVQRLAAYLTENNFELECVHDDSLGINQPGASSNKDIIFAKGTDQAKVQIVLDRWKP